MCVFFFFFSSLSASSLTVSSSSSRGSLASSRGSLASSRGSLSSISFTDIYGVPQYERHDPAGEPLDPHLRYLLPLESVCRDGSVFNPEPLNHGKTKRSHDTPQSLASLSSRSSLSSLSPPSSPMDTPYQSAPPDCPLTQMTEEYMEQAARGLLEGLRVQSQSLSHGSMLSDNTINVHQLEKSHRESGPSGTFTSAGKPSPADACPRVETDPLTNVCVCVFSFSSFFRLGVTLRGNSGNRSGRRARRVSTGLSEDALATDSGVFEAWGRRLVLWWSISASQLQLTQT